MKTFDPNRREALKKAGMAGTGTVAAGLMFGSVANLSQLAPACPKR